MISFVKRIYSAAPIATVLLALALVASVFFAVRATADWVYWKDPAHRNQQIQPWMTPGYIANSWGIPRPEMIALMLELLELPDGRPGRPMSVRRIAEENGTDVDTLIQSIETAIAAHHAANPEGTQP